MGLLINIISGKDRPEIEELYKTEPKSRLPILKFLANKPLPTNQKILPCDIQQSMNNTLCLICLKFPSSSEETEPLIVANFLCRTSKANNPLPLLSEDSESTFSAKTLVALSLFLPAMIKRWKMHGYPNPEYYRHTSINLLKTKTVGHQALASHHKKWEAFLFEQFCPNP